MNKVNDLINETMKKMEERGFTVRQAEMFPEYMQKEIKRNSELFEKEKQFTVFKYDD